MRPRHLAAAIAALTLVFSGFPLAARAIDAVAPAAAPSGYGPSYVVRGQITAPTSVSRGAVCPDALTEGATAYRVPGVTPGRVFSLTADDATYRNDFDIRFFASAGDCAAGVLPLHHLNHAGDEHAVVPTGATTAVVTLATGAPASFTYAELPPSPLPRKRGHKAVTVVAIVETGGSFGIYHDDFLGSHHPWNNDGDPSNDIDFTKPPSSYIPGMPAETAVALTLPTSEDASQAALRKADADKLNGLRTSTPAEPNLYWFPGTKVVAAAAFSTPGPELVADNSFTHASRTASVAAGNMHGTCPECVFVLLRGEDDAVRWATQQKWIDVVSNSWIFQNRVTGYDLGPAGGYTSKDAVIDGQTVVWGAGNGVTNRFHDAPSFTWESSQRGPDWVVTVGGVATANEQAPRGAGRPVDIASYVTGYPATGGDRVDSTGTFDGTSNAAPVVAGTFAEVIQMGRLALGDETPGHGNGVVAEGEPVRCRLPAAVSPCPLGDGVLTQAEVRQVVFDNVLPSAQDANPDFTEVNAPLLPPTDEPRAAHDVSYTLATAPTDFTPAVQGHGIVHGRYDPDRFVAEQRRFGDALVGAVVPYRRPPGETSWMVAASHCRQQLWGTWPGGYYTGAEPAMVEPLDAVAVGVSSACSHIPPGLFNQFQVNKNL